MSKRHFNSVWNVRRSSQVEFRSPDRVMPSSAPQSGLLRCCRTVEGRSCLQRRYIVLHHCNLFISVPAREDLLTHHLARLNNHSAAQTGDNTTDITATSSIVSQHCRVLSGSVGFWLQPNHQSRVVTRSAEQTLKDILFRAYQVFPKMLLK